MKKLLIAAAVATLATNVIADTSSLKTQTANEVGISVSSYEYKEPYKAEHGFWMKLDAVNYGINYLGTYKINDNWFALGNLNYKRGDDDYKSSGSGTDKNIGKDIFEVKVAIGRDFDFDKFVVSPYAGLGFRYLDSDWGGHTSSTGAFGYERESKYYFLPIGTFHRMNLGADSKLETNLEYDYLIRGTQDSKNQDMVGRGTITRYDNAHNKQNSGYGLKASTMYKQNNWGVGPYAEYWHINRSDNAYGSATIGGVTIAGYEFEPANHTTEYGLKASYTF
jgi:hypothetical protein